MPTIASQQQQFTNNATSVIPSVVSSGATTITVTPSTGVLFPVLTGTQFFMATLIDTNPVSPTFGQLEIVKVTARSGDVFTVVRGQEGTLASTFPINSVIELRPTALAFQNLYAEVNSRLPIYNFASLPSSNIGLIIGTNGSTTSFIMYWDTSLYVRLPFYNNRVLITTTGSGTWNPPDNFTKYLLVNGCAGGGAGGRGTGPASGGGGGGQCREQPVTLTSLGTGVAYTIGAGGTGNGGAGGNTTFGSFITMTGGAGGQFRTGPGNPIEGGAGGTGPIAGGRGAYGVNEYYGNGANGLYGMGGQFTLSGTNDNSGKGFGSGGAASSAGNTCDGAPGFLEIWY